MGDIFAQSGEGATVNEATYREYMTSGIPYPIKLPVQGLPDVLKIIASDYGSGLLGTSVTRVRSK